MADGESVEAVDVAMVAAPVVVGLGHTQLDFSQVTENLEHTVIAIRLYRTQNDLGPVLTDPTEAFVQDWQAVAGPLSPPEE